MALCCLGLLCACTSRAADPAAERAALRAAVEDLAETFGEAYPRGGAFLAALDALPADDAAGLEALRREALTANPLVSGRPVLYVSRRQYKPDHHNTETMFQTGEINTASFEGGGALRLLDPATGEVRTLLDVPEGMVRDPELSFDGTRIVFSLRRDIRDDYHIHEMNADGSGLTQLTFAPAVSDIDPLYLPDGGIAFSSSREPKYCMCNRHIMCNLYRMDADGANIVQIGKSTLFEGHGALLPDGRILYYRWEYVDRNFGDAQGLWTVFPDGTSHAVYWGNNTPSPGAVLDARPVPGTGQTLCIFGSCHDRPWGALALIDRRLGLDGAPGGVRSPSVLRTWPADAIEKVGDGDSARFNFDSFIPVSPKYEDPYPLSDKYFLCSRMTGVGEVMGIYLVDVFGNEILLHAEGADESARGCFDPMPLAPRFCPPAAPVRRNFETAGCCDPPDAQPTPYGAGCGRFYIADVYEGTHMEGVARGTVKWLRVVASPEKRHWTAPPWEGQGQAAPAMAWHDFNNKTILGTVPVEEDGSAYFSAPSDTFVYFQLLDERGMMVQSMRSGTVIQSGETQGCVGCHEHRLGAVPSLASAPPRALRRPPDALTGWHGPARTFSYTREVQPVFDRHCVRCHDFGKDAGKTLNLAGDRDLVFNASYNELWRKKYVAVVGAGPAQTQPALSWGSHASKLVRVLLDGHKDVLLSPEEFDRIVTWVDINAPYYPVYASAYPQNLAGRSPLDDAQVDRLTKLTGVRFRELMNFSRDRGPQIAFERPRLSPCVQGLKKKDRAAYKEAVKIIEAGREQLRARPRADMDGFVPCPLDQERESRYDLRRAVEIRNRESVYRETKVYDRN